MNIRNDITKQEAIEILNELIKNVVEEGGEDTTAWEYRAALKSAISNISAGKDIVSELENI